ncbi:MAG: dimethylarginine dimethylaminohydrolase family protein [Rhodospirillales bacterium]
MTATAALPNVWVESEWAELKECVYGSPDTWVLPRFFADSKLRAQGPFAAVWEKHQGQDMKLVDPELFAEFSGQIQGAIDLLEKLGIKTHIAGEISPANRKYPRGQEHGVATAWMRDPFVTIANNVIELAPRSLFHRRQRFAIRPLLASTMARGARYFAQPDSGADDENDGPGWGYLEGGDVFVLGKAVFVGHSGGCSNPEGARWLGHMLGPDFTVETIAIDPLFPHLDCVLMTPREGVAFACLEALPEGLPSYFDGWDVVAVPKALAKGAMGCNNLVLDDRNVVVPSEPELDPIVEALEARKFEVIRIPYRVPCMVGGSFRCAHQPLIRS